MSVINPLARELSAKIVYYGAGLSGKTTTLQAIHAAVRPERRGELVSLATETDRTIFFDFLPLQVERVHGLGVRFQLYTVPGQVFYGATRRLVLNGADGVVFVADSQPSCKDSNLESFEGLRENMADLGIDIEDFPLVFQYNKRDLPNAMPMDELAAALNRFGAPEFGTCAASGEGILPALRAITKLVIRSLTEQQPAVRRQIIDGDDHEPREPEGIARSVAEISRKLSDRAEAPRRPARPPTAPIVVPPPAPPAVAPRTEEPSSRTTSDKLSFAALWPTERETAVRAIEEAITKADYAEAVRAATALLAETTESLPGPHGGAAPGIKATLLCLDGGLYLRVCRLATMPREALTINDALLALHVLVSARLKVQMLGL
ncbi:MAG TPA: GTPase domain-containing protein [Polyangiales bacterium]|nr:GTPase domain-containing protein [Polyangiales bacterium]